MAGHRRSAERRHLKVTGRIDYLDEDGQVIETIDAASQRGGYLGWCAEHGTEPDGRILGED